VSAADKKSHTQVGALWPPFPDVCHCASAEELGTLELEKLDYQVNCGAAGVEWAWVKHPYMWQHFVLITFCSPLFVAFFGIINLQLPESNPGISELLGLASKHNLDEPAPKQVDQLEAPAGAPHMVMMGVQPAPLAFGMQAAPPFLQPGAPAMMQSMQPAAPFAAMQPQMMPHPPVFMQGMQWGVA